MAELSTRKRGDKWEYRFEGAKVDGKRKQISKGGFRTKKEALDAGTKALAEYNQTGLTFEPTEISIHDYLDYWFDTYCKVNLKYNTQVSYLKIIQGHLQPKFGQYKLKALTPTALQEYAVELKMQGYAKSHVYGILTTFSAALNYAVEPLKYISENPMHYVRYPKIERKPKERIILTMEEWNTIIHEFQPPSRYYIPLMIGFYTGLRISEAFALTWEDIDFEKQELTVNKQILKRNFGNDVKEGMRKGNKATNSTWYFNTPKTDKSIRTIKFGTTLAAALKEEKKRQLTNELKYGEYYTIHVLKKETDEKNNPISRMIPLQKVLESTLPRVNLVCINENGEYTSTDSFKYCSRVIHNKLRLAFDYHSLRHTHATLLIENGANVKDVQERLGHQNIETTLQTYVHNTEKMRTDSVDIFELVTSTSVQ